MLVFIMTPYRCMYYDHDNRQHHDHQFQLLLGSFLSYIPHNNILYHDFILCKQVAFAVPLLIVFVVTCVCNDQPFVQKHKQQNKLFFERRWNPNTFYIYSSDSNQTRYHYFNVLANVQLAVFFAWMQNNTDPFADQNKIIMLFPTFCLVRQHYTPCILANKVLILQKSCTSFSATEKYLIVKIYPHNHHFINFFFRTLHCHYLVYSWQES